MSAKVYCFASAKGGSGKTMLTANIATMLGSIGKKCLIIDCDAATHGMTLLYLVEVSSNTHPLRRGLFERSFEQQHEENVEHGILGVSDGVDLLPATYKFVSGVDADSRLEYVPGVLEDALNHLRPKYNFIFLDAQAGSDVHAREAMSRKASDEVIVVSEYDPMSSAGVDRLRHLLGDDLGYARTRILLNKLLPAFVSKFDECLSIMNYLPPVPWNSDVVRAYARRRLALDVQEGNEFTLAIMRTVGELVGEETERELAEWSKERAYALKAPLEEQYLNAEAELVAALETKRRFDLRKSVWRMAVAYSVVVVVAAVGYVITDFGVSKSNVSNQSFDSWPIVAASVSAVLGSVVAASYAAWKWFSGRNTAESLRFERVIATLEERLAKLEVLRSANYEDFIRRRNR